MTANPGPGAGNDADPMHAAALFLLLVMLSGLGMVQSRSTPVGPPPPARTTIDPNVATWWELATLPRIGRALAHEIIRHRDARRLEESHDGHAAASRVETETRPPAFRSAADLVKVRGIGPQTLRRLADHIHY